MVRTVDTRFFLTHFLADSDTLKQKVKSKMGELRKESAIVPTIVIHEVYKFEYQKLGRDTADIDLRSIEKAGFEIAELTIGVAKMAAVLRCRYRNLPTADSIIVATAIEHNSSIVVSDDDHFSKIKEIRTEWI